VSNSAFGFNAGSKNIGGGGNSMFGFHAGIENLGDYNSFFGIRAGQTNVTGTENSFFGGLAGARNTASGNSFFGYGAGNESKNGADNSFFGNFAGSGNSDGNSNAYFGSSAGMFTEFGSQNAFFGAHAGDVITMGNANTAVGFHSAATVQVLTGITAVGAETAPQGDYGTAIGYGAGSTPGIYHSTAIGANALVTTSNTIVIGTIDETTEFPGTVKLLNLGPAGSTSLCRNAVNQISTCTAGNLTQFSSEEITTLRAQNLRMLDQLKNQQAEIDALKAIVCAANPSAKLCAK
jgi:hypothetical protein